MAKLTKPNKILWDSKLWIGEEYRASLINPFTETLSGDLEESNYEALESFYFVVVNNPLRRVNDYKDRITGYFSDRGRIVDLESIKEAKHCDFFRISVAQKVDFDNKIRKFIYRGKWVHDKSLHLKGVKAIDNMVEKIEEEFE